MHVDVDGQSIAYDDIGTGRPVILLHGFPDSGRLWEHQIEALSASGYRAIVPDLVGCGRSDKPADVARYKLVRVARDVTAVLDDCGVQRAHVVGHDWGAALAWTVATVAADRVDHLAVLSVGHPASFARAGLRQREKSWYMLLFQFADVAERWLSDDDWANLRRWTGHPDTEAVIAGLARPGALTAALNWYRANARPDSLLGPPIDLPPVAAPTMGIWSTGDGALTEQQMTGSERWVAGGWRYERLEGPGHWMQREAPDAVNRLLLDFLPATAAS